MRLTGVMAAQKLIILEVPRQVAICRSRKRNAAYIYCVRRARETVADSRMHRAPVYELGTFVSISYTCATLSAESIVVGNAPGTCNHERMPRARLYCVAAALALIGCGNDRGYGDNGDLAPDATTVIAAAGGLPCDVKAILSDHCQTCHGATLAGGAPIHLVTYGDLVATNRDGVPIAQRALDRMRNSQAQMPPPPATSVTGTELATFQTWVAAGSPSSDCKSGGNGPFDGPVVCTSGTHWTSGNAESPLMHPGLPCISCHASSGDGLTSHEHGEPPPIFRVAGTVYPTGHEPNDCNGATTAVVEVTDATGAVTRLPVNAAGNFFTLAALPAPIHVAVAANGKRRAMSMSPPTGDCNSCHTQDGANLAPGRIALP